MRHRRAGAAGGRLKLNGQAKVLPRQQLREALHAKLTTAGPGIQFSAVAFVDLDEGKLGLKLKATGKVAS
jgi:hypothetical protein